MTPLDQLDLDGLRVLDGAMATELEKRGWDISGALWSASVLLDSPDAIRDVHSSYLEAGADCILTASYQVSFAGFREMGLSRSVAEEALRTAAALALTARAQHRQKNPRPIWVAASLGPYGASLHDGSEYHGDYSCKLSDLVAFHRARLAVLNGTGVDLVAFETIPSRQEALAILEALAAFPEIAAWISFSCRDGLQTAHGELLADCGRALDGVPQIVAAGVNCTAPEHVSSLIHSLRNVFSRKIVAYPNSGEIWDGARRCWTGNASTLEFGNLAREWRRAGADWIGGCCRTGPEHIRQISRALLTGNRTGA